MNYQVESRVLNARTNLNDCVVLAFIWVSFFFGTGSIISEITSFKSGHFNYILILVLFLLMFFSFYVSLDQLNKRGIVKDKLKSFLKLERASVLMVFIVCSVWFNNI